MVGLYILLALIILTIVILYSIKVYTTVPTPPSLPAAKEAPPTKVTQIVTPYSTAPINSVDDYEYNLVFKNEADREITREMQNKLMSQYPMDWSTQPPSSAHFQHGMKEMFQNQEQGAESPYTAIVDSSMTPPDTLALEQAERQILQTYQPKHAGDLTTYNVEDAMELIKKIYDKKNEIPTVVKKNDNVYEIIGTRKKDEKIVYDDGTEGPALTESAPVAIPQAAADANINNALDPFFEASSDSTTKKGKWNYREWTPGLERMFAPTESKVNWY